MSGVKLEVQWSPYDPNKFITWGTEIFLYEAHQLKSDPTYSIKLSPTTGANLIATNTNHQYVKCVDIYPRQGSDFLLAIGQANGKVVLTTFGPTVFDALGLVGKDFVPRHARQCNAVAWNPLDSNLIVAALNKDRSDYSVLLWDVMKCPFAGDGTGNGRNGPSGTASGHHHHAAAVVEFARPIAEIGMAETAHSLAWFHSQSRTLAIGMNLKQLKLFDLRDQIKVVNSTSTKAVFGCTVDPHNDRQLASFVDNQICVWDIRNFDKPIITSIQNKPIQKILWCPTRNNLLSSLQRDNPMIHLHDIQHTIIGNEELEQSLLERSVIPGSNHNITSFSWHSTHENRILTISLSGNLVDYTVFERITLNWAPSCDMVWTNGKRTFKLKSSQHSFYNNTTEDISVKIKQRALRDYGLKVELWKNGLLAEDNMLKSLWDWLYLSLCLVEEGSLRGTGLKHPGVRSVLKFDGSPGASGVVTQCELLPWSESSANCATTFKIYKNEERDRALYLCGWRFDKDINALKLFLERLELDNTYSKAAMIAVFNLRIRLGIDILNRGAEKTSDSNLSVVAMALAGFTDEKNSMWRQFCQATLKQLKDPYLRAMFSFLTCDADSYDGVLNESGVAVEDRVAFACMFLSDTKLNEYLKQLTATLTEEGNLAGLLLTGTTSEGIDVLQKYLDHTGDVQSVSLLSIRAFPPALLQESAVQEWIASYRTMLDAWHLWNQRALFDIEFSSCSAIEKPPQQVYVSCNYCGKSISAYMQAFNRGRGSFARLGAGANKLKLSSCPNCRKPLPRCAICLMHMGTASSCPSYSDRSGRSEAENNKMVEYSSWFTWCQLCRHGGHAAHMTHWFQEHSECPVTACSCKCFSVDAC